jgi:flavin reductase (DIM6/NTAB) family NADH-FMN oxidoreductase RutF
MISSASQLAPQPTGTRNDLPISGGEFRRVMGHLPTGVAVVAAVAGGAPVGMAINSITSVSLDPPLIAICIDNASATWPHIRRTGSFSVSILPAHHEHASRQFSGPSENRFVGVGWHAHETGPVLDESVAWIDCTVHQEHSAGDHTIVVARALDLGTAEDGNALLFFRGQYGHFIPATRTS